MWYVALTLGFFGSMHCIGMCGPIAITFCTNAHQSTLHSFFTGLSYNIGRVITYMAMGLLFGTLGSFVTLTNMQSGLSVVLGAVLIITFLFSWNIENKINSIQIMKDLYSNVHILISKIMARGQKANPLLIGMANGLLPCGLVYLAIAGSLVTGSAVNGMFFMGLFGMGTIPALLILTTATQVITTKRRMQLKRVIPFLQLAFGIYLVYRGLFIEMNETMNFWEALKNPIMCGS